MTEQDLLNLGFKIQLLNEDFESHYLYYPLCDDMNLITLECSDEAKGDLWTVCFDNNAPFTYTTPEQVKNLINALEINITKK